MSDGEAKKPKRVKQPKLDGIFSPVTSEQKDRLREKTGMIEALIDILEKTVSSSRWAVFAFRLEDGHLPLEHVVFNWADADWPAVVNDVRVRVLEIQQDNLVKRQSAGDSGDNNGKEFNPDGNRRSRIIGTRPSP